MPSVMAAMTSPARRDEEIEALQAIYCDGEMEVDRGEFGAGVVLTFHLPLESGASLRLRFHLPTGYPDTPPECEASSSELSRRQHSALSALARSTAESPEFEGRECIFDILGIVHEAAHKIISDSAAHLHAASGEGNSSPEGEEEEELCCLKLDHMRDEQRYIKHIRTWTRDLGLRGRLLLQGRNIFIVLHGAPNLISQYISLQRTQQVDVDSNGRKCKERMLQILSRAPRDESLYQDFQVHRLEKRDELEEALRAAGLQDHLD